MIAFREIRGSFRRAILIYLFAIVGPTLVFLYLGLQSVQRQRQAITSLTVSNLRLSGERLAAELERRAWQLAKTSLQDDELLQLQLAPGDANYPEEARQLRMLLERVRDRHSVVRHYFILRGSSVIFPLVRTRSFRQLDDYITGEDQETGKGFVALFTEGENRELRRQRPKQALSFYRKSYEMPVSEGSKALALARVARCLRKANQVKAAERAYRKLGERFSDLYDGFHRPYALVAAFELDDLGRAQGGGSSEPLIDIYWDLLQGRWELSTDQIEYFLAAIEERLEKPVLQIGESEYLSHLEMASALQEGFRHYGLLRPGEVYACAFSQGEISYQALYTPLRAGRGTETLVGFAVDLNWVESQLLPQCRRELEVDEGLAVALKAAKTPAPYMNDLAAYVSFRTLFPFWQLSIAPVSVEAWKATTRRGMLAFAGSTLLILCVLILGVFLLMRDVSRELRLGRLRADFISSVSHELKTPLTLIRLYGETLLHGKHFREKERRSYYQIITRESERLSHLIEKVLDFSRIDRGQKQYHLREGDLAPVVARTVEVYGEYLMRQGFSVKTDLATHLPPVQFDPDAISEAILNLMDNAAKFAGESKLVGVRLRFEDNQVVFEVEDHGTGIPASEHEKIFQQFYRAPGRTGKGGYGLGLFLVKHIMDAHSGKIELESEPGRGSLFRLIFPVRESGEGVGGSPGH